MIAALSIGFCCRSNAALLDAIDTALFVVCLDDLDMEDSEDGASVCAANMLHGTYKMDKAGVQVHRWPPSACAAPPLVLLPPL